MLRLQGADDALAALNAEVRSLHGLLRGEPELDARRARARDAHAQQDEAAAQLSAAEQQLSSLEKRVATLNRRLYDGSVRNPAELLEMQRELEVLRGQRGDAEEQVLQLIEAAETAQAGAADSDGALAALESSREHEDAPRRQRLAELQQRLGAAQSARDQALAALTPTEQALYARVASHHHPAVVSIKGDACGGCHLPLSNEERRAVRAGDTIVQCSNCDRILVP